MTFDEFYSREYLPRHADGRCRLLHFLGALAAAALLGVTVWLGVAVSPWAWWLLLVTPAPAYAFAWLGHLLVPNHPTFFQHPVLSFLGYWKMIGSMATGKL